MGSNLVPGQDSPSPDVEFLEKVCDGMIDKNGPEISHMAYESLYIRGLPNDAFVLMCVEWIPRWRALMEEFVPGYDWEEGEDPEEVVCVSVQVSSSICGLLCEHFPKYIEDLMTPPSEGKAKAIALAGNVCVLYDIEPIPLGFQ